MGRFLEPTTILYRTLIRAVRFRRSTNHGRARTPFRMTCESDRMGSKSASRRLCRVYGYAKRACVAYKAGCRRFSGAEEALNWVGAEPSRLNPRRLNLRRDSSPASSFEPVRSPEYRA
ncbi:hypothetical protein AOLI_G00220470 [Acnodon oligacanthus]